MDPEQVARLAVSVAQSPQQTEMAVRIGQALDLPHDLWRLVPAAVAVAEEQAEVSPAAVADATPAGRRLDERDRVRVRNLADEWLAAARVRFDTIDLDASTAPPSLTRADAMADPFGLVAGMIDVPGLAADLMPAFADIPLASVEEWSYLTAYIRAAREPSRSPRLLPVLLTMAISTIEPLVTRMVHHLLHHTDPARRPMIDPTLDADARRLCRGGPTQWRDVLVGRFAVQQLAAAIDWTRLIELWEDRNAVAHRGGVVDARHHARSGIEIGTILNPDARQVQENIDEIAALRYGIVATVWDRLQPGTGATIAAGLAGPNIWESLRARRWRLADGLGRVQLALAGDPETAAVARVHRWLAVDQGRGPAAIRHEVEAWDTTGLPAIFQLAHQILLRHDDEAVSQANELVATGDLTPADLASWPLFDRLRDEGRFTNIRASAYPHTRNPTLDRLG